MELAEELSVASRAAFLLTQGRGVRYAREMAQALRNLLTLDGEPDQYAGWTRGTTRTGGTVWISQTNPSDRRYQEHEPNQERPNRDLNEPARHKPQLGGEQEQPSAPHEQAFQSLSGLNRADLTPETADQAMQALSSLPLEELKALNAKLGGEKGLKPPSEAVQKHMGGGGEQQASPEEAIQSVQDALAGKGDPEKALETLLQMPLEQVKWLDKGPPSMKAFNQAYENITGLNAPGSVFDALDALNSGEMSDLASQIGIDITSAVTPQEKTYLITEAMRQGEADAKKERRDAGEPAVIYPEGYRPPEGHANQPSPFVPNESRPDLSFEEAEALTHYTKGGDEALNWYLQGRSSGRFQFSEELHKRLQGAFAKAKEFKEPVTVYRGISMQGSAKEELLNRLRQAHGGGIPLQMAGYQSTSTERSSAFDGNFTFAINAFRGLDAQPYSHFSEEQEFLLNHDDKYIVEGIEEYEPGYFEVSLTHVPDFPAEGISTGKLGGDQSAAGEPTEPMEEFVIGGKKKEPVLHKDEVVNVLKEFPTVNAALQHGMTLQQAMNFLNTGEAYGLAYSLGIKESDAGKIKAAVLKALEQPDKPAAKPAAPAKEAAPLNSNVVNALKEFPKANAAIQQGLDPQKGLDLLKPTEIWQLAHILGIEGSDTYEIKVAIIKALKQPDVTAEPKEMEMVSTAGMVPVP